MVVSSRLPVTAWTWLDTLGFYEIDIAGICGAGVDPRNRAVVFGLDSGNGYLDVRGVHQGNGFRVVFGRLVWRSIPPQSTLLQMLWSPSLTVVVARQQYGRRHSLAQESRTRSSSLEHRSLITAFACRSLLSLEDESVLESDHTVVSECLESNNNKEL